MQKEVLLGDIIRISKGKKHEHISSEKLNDERRFIQIDDLRNDNNLKYTKEKGIDVTANDIIIAWDGANAGTIGFNLDGYIGSTLARLRIYRKGFSTEYLGWYLRSKFKYLQENCTGATIPHINKNSLETLRVPDEDLRTQQKIAQILSEADKARQLRKQANALTDQFLQSTFLSMFGDPVSNPKRWKVGYIGDLLEFMTSGSRGWARYYSESGDVFLRINNVGYSELKTSDLIYVNTPDTAEAKRTLTKEGDVLFSITADLGRTAVIPKGFPKSYINQHLALLRLNKKNILPIFFTNFFATTAGRSQIINKGGVKLGLNFDDIKNLKVYLPPIKLQQQFADIVADTEQLRQRQRAHEQELDQLFKGLLQKYFG